MLFQKKSAGSAKTVKCWDLETLLACGVEAIWRVLVLGHFVARENEMQFFH